MNIAHDGYHSFRSIPSGHAMMTLPFEITPDSSTRRSDVVVALGPWWFSIAATQTVLPLYAERPVALTLKFLVPLESQRGCSELVGGSQESPSSSPNALSPLPEGPAVGAS